KVLEQIVKDLTGSNNFDHLIEKGYVRRLQIEEKVIQEPFWENMGVPRYLEKNASLQEKEIFKNEVKNMGKIPDNDNLSALHTESTNMWKDFKIWFTNEPYSIKKRQF